MDIQELKLLGAAGEGSEVFQPLDADGNYLDPYTWYSAEMASYFGGTKEGWYDSNGTLVTLSLGLGNGFYISIDVPASGYEAIKVQTSGSVRLTALAKTLYSGYNITGNSSPIVQDIQNFKLKGAPGEGSEVLQPLDSAGNYLDPYTWYSAEMASYFGGTTAGWYDSNGTLVVMPLDPGKGIFISVASDVEIEIPASVNQ